MELLYIFTFMWRNKTLTLLRDLSYRRLEVDDDHHPRVRIFSDPLRHPNLFDVTWTPMSSSYSKSVDVQKRRIKISLISHRTSDTSSKSYRLLIATPGDVNILYTLDSCQSSLPLTDPCLRSPLGIHTLLHRRQKFWLRRSSSSYDRRHDSTSSSHVVIEKYIVINVVLKPTFRDVNMWYDEGT